MIYSVNLLTLVPAIKLVGITLQDSIIVVQSRFIKFSNVVCIFSPRNLVYKVYFEPNLYFIHVRLVLGYEKCSYSFFYL